MAKKTNLEGRPVVASDCCGANIQYKLGDLDVENSSKPRKDAPVYCVNCGKQCEAVEYILIRKDSIQVTTKTKIRLKLQ